jgi:DNA-binding FadR family transcriptional regulator
LVFICNEGSDLIVSFAAGAAAAGAGAHITSFCRHLGTQVPLDIQVPLGSHVAPMLAKRPANKNSVRARPPARLNRVRGPNLRIPKTAELIADHIRKMIIRGELQDGDYLEPQGQLIDSYSVSRPTVREAFRILEAEELISVQRGSRTGARIHRPKSDVVARQAGLVLQAQGTTLADVQQARLAIEPWAARLIARRHSAQDIAHLRTCVQAAHDSIVDSTRFAAAIIGFHEALVDLSGNGTLRLLIAIVRGVQQRHEGRLVAHLNEVTSIQARRKQNLPVLKSFEKLIAFIEAGDEVGAEKHWRLHMENATKSWAEDGRGGATIDLLD